MLLFYLKTPEQKQLKKNNENNIKLWQERHPTLNIYNSTNSILITSLGWILVSNFLGQTVSEKNLNHSSFFKIPCYCLAELRKNLSKTSVF